MFSRRLVALAATLVASGFSSAVAAEKMDLDRIAPVPADQPIPIQDFFRPPLMTEPQINETGTFLAANVDLGDHAALLVANLQNMKIDVMRGSKDKDLYTFSWLDNTSILTSWTTEKLYSEGIFVANAANLQENHALEAYSVMQLVGVPREARSKPLIWIVRNAYDDGHDGGIVQIDTTKSLGRNKYAMSGTVQAEDSEEAVNLYGTRAAVVRNFPKPATGVVVDYMADADGKLAFAMTASQGVYSLYRFAGEKWQACPVDLDAIDVIDVGDHPDELIVLGPRQDGKPRPLQRMQASTGQLGEVLLQDAGYDPDGASLYRNPASGAILGVRCYRGRYITAWFDPDYAAIQQMLDTNFAGKVTRIIGSDRAGKFFLLAVYSDRQAPIYYSLDLEKRALGLIKAANPWLDPERMRPVNLLKFKTRDGHHLEAFLTLPAGVSKDHPAPLVVLPHGGPWARDSWGFSEEVQFLASRGYAVLQPNYRGSTGYDWMFPSSDLWAFRKMHEDVTDAVKTLVRSGLVDPQRMAIMGTSFGGYLALSGAAFEPDLYRCAVTISGVFDYEQVMKESKYDQHSTAKYGILLRNLGDPKTHEAAFNAAAPLRHVQDVKIPVFVAHGKEDVIAEVTESRALIGELEKFHVPHEVMIVAGEGHGMSKLKNQVELYSRVEAFLAKYLAPKVAAAGSAAGP